MFLKLRLRLNVTNGGGGGGGGGTSSSYVGSLRVFKRICLSSIAFLEIKSFIYGFK